MPTSDAPRLALIRGATWAGIAALLLTGVNLLFLPAAVVGILAAVAGLRQIRHDIEAATLRLGAALLASLVVAVGGVIAGSGIVAAPAGILSLVAFVVAWRAADRLREDRRRAWGVRQGLILQRDRELHERQRALQDRRDRPAVDDENT